MTSERSNLILVEVSKRLDNLEPISRRGVYSHLLQNIMLSLDPALCLNPVRRDRPLTEARNFPLARTRRIFSDTGDRESLSLTCSGSPDRRRPVSIMIGRRLSPSASLATKVATVLSTPPDTAEITLLPCVSSRSLRVSSERKLDGWKPWTATDNRSPILGRLGYANLFLFFPASKLDRAFA